MSVLENETNSQIALEGARKSRGNLTGARIRIVMAGLVVVFGLVTAKLVVLANSDVDFSVEVAERDAATTATRPTIVDRNGLEMALDITAPSLFAEPSRMVDKEEALAKLLQELPDLDPDWLKERLSRDKDFVWLARELSPTQQDRIFNLGLPGIDFKNETKRYYPGNEVASHILGMVNIDQQGLAGLEERIDRDNLSLLQDLGFARGRQLEDVELTIDMRVQHAVREVLLDGLERYKAIAAAGVVLDAYTGETIAMVSLPDFNPNDPATFTQRWLGKKDQRFNRITLGRYELGSTFKTISFAATLDSGKVRLRDKFDARFPVRFGKYSIDDFHGKRRILSVPEVYKYSSNIGTIKMMQEMGKDEYRAFLSKIGFDERLAIELPETIESNIPDKFSEIVAATASYGHGLAVTPLHMASAVSALVNGGNFVPATLFPRSLERAKEMGRPVVSETTSDLMRYLMRLNALEGSGTHARKMSAGYGMAGKTGTAEKVVNGRYSSEKSLTVFASAFPIDEPRYAMVILVDEPQRENEKSGRTAGWNAGEVSGRVLERIAPMLGIAPDFNEDTELKLIPRELL